MNLSTRTLPTPSAQPWLRDHYASLRSDVGPRWEYTRAAVVPVLSGASHKVRTDLAPAAAHYSAHLTTQALNRSAPLRSEIASRYAAAIAAARGQITADQIAQLNRPHTHRRLWFVGAAAAAGATLGAVVAWQRSHEHDWTADDESQGTNGDTYGRPATEPAESGSDHNKNGPTSGPTDQL